MEPSDPKPREKYNGAEKGPDGKFVSKKKKKQ